MTPHAVMLGDIPVEVMETFTSMRSLIEALPDIPNEKISCHSLCKALSELFNVTYHEGVCGQCDHGWLRSSTNPGVLMDMYPVAGAASFIVFTDTLIVPWATLYKECQISYSDDDCKRQVEKLIVAMRQQL